MQVISQAFEIIQQESIWNRSGVYQQPESVEDDGMHGVESDQALVEKKKQNIKDMLTKSDA